MDSNGFQSGWGRSIVGHDNNDDDDNISRIDIDVWGAPLAESPRSPSSSPVFLMKINKNNSGAVGEGHEHQTGFGRGFPKGEGSTGPQRVPRCEQKSVSVVTSGFNVRQTARSPRGQPCELPAAFGEIFARNSAGSAGLLKETLAALRAALNFSKSAF